MTWTVFPRPGQRGQPLQPCGTWAGAQRHWKAREPLCDACREASRQHDRDRKTQKKTPASR